MGLLRVFGGIIVALIAAGSWLLLACVVMVVCLYIARLVPLTGRRKQ
jgi:hypothetical protein